MGETTISVHAKGMRPGASPEGPVRCVVDTGAMLPVLPVKVLAGAGVRPLGTLEIELADGRVVRRKYGDALLILDGEALPARVIFGQRKDPPLLGVTVLEIGGLLVDPVGRKLQKRRAYQQFWAARGGGPANTKSADPCSMRSGGCR